jgi:pilus assembly protein Flp/PilA
MGSEPMTEIETLHSKIRQELKRFCMDESGATAIEYGLVAAGVGVTVAGTVWSVGGKVKATLYDKLATMF